MSIITLAYSIFAIWFLLGMVTMPFVGPPAPVDGRYSVRDRLALLAVFMMVALIGIVLCSTWREWRLALAEVIVAIFTGRDVDYE